MRDKLVTTKKGISLRLHQIKVLSDRMELVEEALRQNEWKKFHLGYNVFVSLRKDNPCVDIGLDTTKSQRRGSYETRTLSKTSRVQPIVNRHIALTRRGNFEKTSRSP